MAKKESKKDVTVTSKDKERPYQGRMLTPFEEMERFFGRFGHGWMRPVHWGRPPWADLSAPFEGMAPSVDVIDREEEIVVRAELPGVDKKDLEVTLSEDTLTIKGSTKTEKKEEKGDYFRREVSSGAFARSVRLPAAVDGENVASSFKDGILELTLPKLKKSKRHTINVE
jgi:HSP20 family protein